MQYFRNHEEYVRPYWDGGLIVNESILPLHKRGESGEVVIRLMNDIKRIVSVRTATLDVEFDEGRDYFVRDGLLVIPEDSRIGILSWEEYNPSEPDGKFNFTCGEGGYLLFGEGNSFHKRQYAVTYESASNCFDGCYHPTAAPELANSRRLIDSVGLKLAFYGDSITYGANASGLSVGLAPFMPIYPMLAAETLRGRGYTIDYYNPSIGGLDSAWGRSKAAYYFDSFKPDLTLIAFGMNDGTGRLPADRFVDNIKSIIDSIRRGNPAAEFILTATTLPNPLANYFCGLQPDYEQPLGELAKSEGCAFLDMTELHRILLSRKEYYHMTGNNINHPSDFLARVYAQGLLTLLDR